MKEFPFVCVCVYTFFTGLSATKCSVYFFFFRIIKFFDLFDKQVTICSIDMSKLCEFILLLPHCI